MITYKCWRIVRTNYGRTTERARGALLDDRPRLHVDVSAGGPDRAVGGRGNNSTGHLQLLAVIQHWDVGAVANSSSLATAENEAVLQRVNVEKIHPGRSGEYLYEAYQGLSGLC